MTYTTALSLVPILALAFSVLKGMGESERLRPVLERYLALGSAETSAQLMKYVENVNAAAIGSLGAGLLTITVISTMGTIEQAFNAIFGVRRSRGYLRKFTDYLSVLFTVPLLMTAALAATAVFSVHVARVPVLAALIPYLFAWAGFLFLFVFFPYTKVRYGPALFGSFVTAVLFQLGQWGYVKFQIGVSSYRAIYGALATVPIFLVWIYVAWAIVLFGAEVTATAQRGVEKGMPRPGSPEFPFAAALYLLARLANRQRGKNDGVEAVRLASELGVTEAALGPVIDKLEEDGLVVHAASGRVIKEPRLFLVRIPSAIKLSEVYALVMPDLETGGHDGAITILLKRLHETRREVLGSLTLEAILSPSEEEDLSGRLEP